MHYLLTNDDGIHAPGLAALASVIQGIPGARCTIVAPAVEQSQCGHRVTTHEPLTLTQLTENSYSVAGTPADCVRVALFALGLKPDMVLSGVNAGGNMGQDLYISGTVAGAREAAFHGLPAVAFSHYLLRNTPVDWGRTAQWTQVLLQELQKEELSDGEFWNVNYPHLPAGPCPMPIRLHSHVCRAPLNVAYAQEPSHGAGTLTLRYTASYASRPVEPGSDVAACFGGLISVTRLRI